jgi:hypothetical protein
MKTRTTPPATAANAVYAVTLLAALPQQAGRLAGRLEHVLSGRRHDFDDGPALLACLALEQRLAASSALPVTTR